MFFYANRKLNNNVPNKKTPAPPPAKWMMPLLSDVWRVIYDQHHSVSKTFVHFEFQSKKIMFRFKYCLAVNLLNHICEQKTLL